MNAGLSRWHWGSEAGTSAHNASEMSSLLVPAWGKIFQHRRKRHEGMGGRRVPGGERMEKRCKRRFKLPLIQPFTPCRQKRTTGLRVLSTRLASANQGSGVLTKQTGGAVVAEVGTSEKQTQLTFLYPQNQCHARASTYQQTKHDLS